MMRYSLALLAVVVIVWSGRNATTTAQETHSAPIVAQASNDRERWAIDLAERLGNSQPSSDIVSLLVAWQRAEGGSAAFNPLNTTQESIGATCYNSDPCVKNYTNYESGMNATIETLSGDQPGYAEIVVGIQTNDPDRILAGLRVSPWGTQANLAQAVWSEIRQSAPIVPTHGGFSSNPISLSGDCGWNVKIALEGNAGALQHVKLNPGETFSFNATMGDPDGDPALIKRRYCAGVDGGNWCNLAARYAQVARSVGLVPMFQDHGAGDLGGGAENSVAIWNVDGKPGNGQDLLIANTTNHAVVFQAQAQNGSIVVIASIE